MERKFLWAVGAVLAGGEIARAQQGGLILNEFNGVSATQFLEADDEPFEGRDYGVLRDLTLAAGPAKAGRIKGNGGNWLELVVTLDRLDIRGWTLNWSNADVNTPPTPENPNPLPENMGTVQFLDNPLWSNLRRGTIITIVEDSSFEPEFEDGTFLGHDIDLTDDVSYNPKLNDWWIHVETKESDPASPYIATPNSKFKTDNDSWQLTIRNTQGQAVFGPVGEAVAGWGGSGINNQEVGILHDDPSATSSGLQFNDRDYSSFGAPNLLDPTDSARTFEQLVPQDFSSLRDWWTRTDRIAGDFNLDRKVNLEDLMLLAQYWQTTGHEWMPVDWDENGIVDAADLGLLAQNWQAGVAGLPFEAALAEAGLVPEPACAMLLMVPLLLPRRRRMIA